MALKVALLALFILAFLYVVYRAADWYFTKKEAETDLKLKREQMEMARDEAVWLDDDPETVDDDEFRRLKAELENDE